MNSGDSLKKKSLNSVMWSAIERFSVQGIQVILSLIIARLISPSDYGLMAMLTIFLALAQAFIDSGFTQALIQKKNRTEVDYSTVFYFNIGISVLVYAALFFCAPLIADFYEEPFLVTLTRWIGLNLIISALLMVQQARLIINLQFKKQAKLSLIAVIISGTIGVLLAYFGYGVWALVTQTLTKNIVNGILLWIAAKWLPRLIFSWKSFKELFGFGSKLLLGGLIHSLYTNIYTLVIGKIFNAKDVGFYNQAQTLSFFPPSNITYMISRAIYPIQCQLQDDNKQLKEIFIQYLRLATFIVFPLMVGLSALANPLIKVVLTDKWEYAATLMSIICIAYMWQPIQSLNGQLLSVKGRTDLSLKSEIVKKIVAAIILLSTIPGGIEIMCWGLLLYALLDIVIVIYYVKKVLEIGYMEEARNLFPFLLLSLSMGLVIWGITYFIENNIAKLISGILSGVIVYIALGLVFKVKEFNVIYNYIRAKSKASGAK